MHNHDNVRDGGEGERGGEGREGEGRGGREEERRGRIT